MMFMIPMPPTSSETPAIAASSVRHRAGRLGADAAMSSSVRTMKSSGSLPDELVPHAQRSRIASATGAVSASTAETVMLLMC